MLDALAISTLIPWLTDYLEDWSPDPPDLGELEDCERDRCAADAREDPALPGTPPQRYPIVDLEAKAAGTTYANGQVKRTRYSRVDLGTRKVVIGLHQAGVERTESRWRQTAHRVTCHCAVGPTGHRYRVHPLDRRLVCTNRVDRAPWHCVGIETLGNFRGTPTGDWYKPETFGRGELGRAQLEALRQEIEGVVAEVAELGGEVIGILPHRTTGRNRRGIPNRQICCGWEVWSGAGEWSGATLGLRVPGPDWSLGGLPIPDAWHGPWWPKCDRRLQ